MIRVTIRILIQVFLVDIDAADVPSRSDDVPEASDVLYRKFSFEVHLQSSLPGSIEVSRSHHGERYYSSTLF